MPNFSTEIADELTKLSAYLPRVEGSMMRDLKRNFASFQADMLAEVARYDVTGVSAMSYRKKRAKALIKSIKEMIANTYTGFHKATEAELVSLAGTTQTSMITAVNGVAQAELLTRIIDSPQLRQIVKGTVIDGAVSAAWWKRQGDNLAFKFQNVVQDSIIKGSSLSDTVRAVRGSRELNYADGIMNTSYRNARALIQTSVQNVVNTAKLEVMQANDDIIEGIQWLSTLDGRTSPICRALDGLIWDLEYKPVGHSKKWVGSTAHWNCRSTQVPYLGLYDNLPPAKKKLMEGTRASMDGQVAKSTNYDSWLKAQDKKNPAFVQDVLGKNKYKIWKKKGLSMRDMVDQYSNPLTADQLAAKYNITTG